MSTLDESEISALHAALDDEYHAWETYDQVIRDFGLVRPFSNIRDAEARHIAAEQLARLVRGDRKMGLAFSTHGTRNLAGEPV